MAVQTVPFALQNASHSAALFRQSASAPFATGGILSSAELTVSQQGTPNMSVVLGPGRAKISGTSVSSPLGGSAFTTQAMYDTLNDANLTLTVTTANATNPRIDAAYIQVQDAFYSGATNTAIAGVVAGVPAASPVAPAVPSNSILIAYLAVAANATSVVTANITYQASAAALLGAVTVTNTSISVASVAGGATIATSVIPALPYSTIVDVDLSATVGNGSAGSVPIGTDFAVSAGTLTKFYTGGNNAPSVLSGVFAGLPRAATIAVPANTAVTLTTTLITSGAGAVYQIQGGLKLTRRQF